LIQCGLLMAWMGAVDLDLILNFSA